MLRFHSPRVPTRVRAAFFGAGIAAAALSLAACVADESDTAPATTPAAPAPTVAIKGNVSGLTGQGLVLQNNLADDLSVPNDGQFGFATLVAPGASYSVTVKRQPANPTQTCTVNAGSGTVGAAGVDNVSVVCSTATIRVSGTVSGLTGSGLVLQNNAGDDVSVSANGSFAFPTPVAGGAGYAVTVKSQPVAPRQQCTINGASGTAAGVGIGNVAVSCTLLASRFAYVARYSSGAIMTFAVDASTGALSSGTSMIVPGVPFGVASDPAGKFLFASEVGSGTLQVYAINDATGALTAVPGSPYPTGNTPTNVTMHPSGKFVYTANFNSANLSAFSLDASTGALTAIPGSPFAAGTGPRIVMIDPAGKFAYVPNMGENTIRTYAINASTGALSQTASTALPPGSGPLAIAVHPQGKFLYVANSSGNAVSAFTIDAATGSLTPLSQTPAGMGPWILKMDPTGRFLYTANQIGNSISAYSIDSVTGMLTPTATVPTNNQPIALAFDASGTFVYVSNYSSANVSIYRIDATTGVPAPIGGALPNVINPTGILLH